MSDADFNKQPTAEFDTKLGQKAGERFGSSATYAHARRRERSFGWWCCSYDSTRYKVAVLN